MKRFVSKTSLINDGDSALQQSPIPKEKIKFLSFVTSSGGKTASTCDESPRNQLPVCEPFDPEPMLFRVPMFLAQSASSPLTLKSKKVRFAQSVIEPSSADLEMKSKENHSIPPTKHLKLPTI